MMNKILVALFLFVIAIPSFGHQLKIVNLTCEYRVNPLGIDVANPSLSYQLQSAKRNILQTAYQILVSDNLADLKANKGNIWDSKKIVSNQSIQIKYK